MKHQIMTVPFHNDTVVLIEQDGQPFVAMKPMAENIGLDWKAQYDKITEKFASTMGIIPMVAEDGKMREMICLPLRKLPAWLYSINPNKVAPELRDKIIAYQEECDEVLWRYWTEGEAINPRNKPPARDSLLEMCIKEFGRGNEAAAHTLRTRYGMDLDLPSQKKRNTKPRNPLQYSEPTSADDVPPGYTQGE